MERKTGRWTDDLLRAMKAFDKVVSRFEKVAENVATRFERIAIRAASLATLAWIIFRIMQDHLRK